MRGLDESSRYTLTVTFSRFKYKMRTTPGSPGTLRIYVPSALRIKALTWNLVFAALGVCTFLILHITSVLQLCGLIPCLEVSILSDSLINSRYLPTLPTSPTLPIYTCLAPGHLFPFPFNHLPVSQRHFIRKHRTFHEPGILCMLPKGTASSRVRPILRKLPY